MAVSTECAAALLSFRYPSLLFIKVSKVGTGLEEIKVKSDVAIPDVAIPDVAHSALPFLLLVESTWKNEFQCYWT